ncbi:hypothetical protein JVT61DRAFT_11069 [Boletus reticuloceps]|uniref:Uncharacterized protein n=1 Tax=Boletus reticuloceps TaxID=495285 RepID=A0A8I2YER8_9AGAM|nr:hypothetical protein JVT61DRAFT_11069 [Boletus reticuloceps]
MLIHITDKLSVTVATFNDYEILFAISHIILSHSSCKPKMTTIYFSTTSKKNKRSLCHHFVQQKVSISSTKVLAYTLNLTIILHIYMHFHTTEHDTNATEQSDTNVSPKKNNTKDKKRVKTQPPQDSDIEEKDQPLIKNIKMLKDLTTVTFCFGIAGLQPLYLKGPMMATLETPSNNDLFQHMSDDFVGQWSLLAQLHFEVDKKTTVPEVPSVSSVNEFLPQLVVQMIQASHVLPPEAPQAPLAQLSCTSMLFLPAPLESMEPQLLVNGP